MAPAQGWHAQIEKWFQNFLPDHPRMLLGYLPILSRSSLIPLSIKSWPIHTYSCRVTCLSTTRPTRLSPGRVLYVSALYLVAWQPCNMVLPYYSTLAKKNLMPYKGCPPLLPTQLRELTFSTIKASGNAFMPKVPSGRLGINQHLSKVSHSPKVKHT